MRHRFTYRSYSWLVDLDHVPERSVVASFESADHCGDPSKTLRRNVDAFLETHGIDLQGGRVLMLTSPRSLGYAFNPLTVYWCTNADGEQACVIAEVHNTYGGRYRYLLTPDIDGTAWADKKLYVSPFNATDGRYEITAPPPDQRLKIGVSLHRDGLPPFVATVNGRRLAVTKRSRMRAVTAGAGVRTSALIRRQGVALWRKGLPVVPRPKVWPREPNGPT